MSLLTQTNFSFYSEGLPKDTFTVVDFQGVEGLSKDYRFAINLISTDPDLDLAEVLQHPATLVIHREDDDLPFHGILARLDLRQSFQDYFFYQATLVPRFWWLTLTHHNQVFLDQSIPDVLKVVLQDGGLSAEDCQLRCQGDYPQWEYVCQYRESHFDFVSRWMEREGIYFFFEQTESGEQLILTDTHLAHVAMPQGESVTFSPVSGLGEDHLSEEVRFFVCSQTMMPQRVKVKDYNYQTPSLDLIAQADVSPRQGRGEFYFYGDHFRTTQEGERLAGIRAESLLCRGQIFSGQSSIPYLRPGYIFSLKNHFKKDFNQKYLTIAIEHHGSQQAFLVSGLSHALKSREKVPLYQNTFSAIPAAVQFRPEIKTPKPRFYGSMNARIDAAGSGQYAELDHEGRYKVILPFDLSGRDQGRASTWLRMMQPYGGSNHGFHFPLHKSTEVLLTFIDGDPDRPVIAGAVPNPEHPSLVKDLNQTSSLITTSGQNKIHMEDEQGSERILMHSPKAGSFIRLGTPNDPVWGDKPEYTTMTPNKDGISLVTSQALDIKAATSNTIILGENSATTIGADMKNVFLGREDLTIGGRLNITAPFVINTIGGTVATVGVTKNEAWGTKATAAAQKTKAVADELQAIGAATKAIGEETKAIGSVTKAEGDRTQAIGSHTQAIAQRTQAIGDLTKAIGEKTGAIGVETKAIGEATKAIGEETKAIGETTAAIGMETAAIGETTAAIGMTTAAIGEETKAIGEATQAAGEFALVAGLVSLM